MAFDRNADFLARRNAPGVFRDWDMDGPSSLGKLIGLTGGNWLNLSSATSCGSDGVFPVLDPDVRASGKSALRFDLPDQHGGNYGLWSTRFSDDNTLQFRANSTLWYQHAHRINGVLANTFLYAGGSGAASGPGAFQNTTPTIIDAIYVDATTIAVAGNQTTTFVKDRACRTFKRIDPRGTSSFGIIVSSTSDAPNNRTLVSVSIRNGGDPGAAIPNDPTLDGAQVVAQNYGQGGYKVIDITQGAKGTTDPGSSSDVKLVNIITNRNVGIFYQSNADQGVYATPAGKILYQSGIPTSIYGVAVSPKDVKTYPGCFLAVPDAWITTTGCIELLGLSVNAAGTASSWDWRFRVWQQIEDGDPVLVHDWNPSTPGYFRLYAGDPKAALGLGKFNAFPYFTSKAPDQRHGLGQVWYDEILLSTQPIAFVGASRVTIPVGGTTMATQAQLDQTVTLCGQAYDSAAAAAGSPTIAQQVAAANAAGQSAGAAAQLATDQAAITAANAARDQALAAASAVQAKKDAEDAAIDAAQAANK